MKDVLSKKRKSGDYVTIALSKECSAIFLIRATVG